ncbi:hypothetical protein QBC47DRAFT_380509 [Echria macrotheca]|uniref:Uncharacterized protein n=1 Tax=Echria macrotheca TaxID=438768 RepID=A0AAJ0BBZ1_9PEZI|nr:hypothetical protein QBC47DRAFT_380509 [Echria macrotheca]
MATSSDPIPPLPSATPVSVTADITIHPPLSRRGTGPGLLLVVSSDLDLSSHEKSLDPPPLQKWAEESFAVAQITVGDDASGLSEQLAVALAELKKLPECESADKVAVVVIKSSVDATLLSALQSRPEIAAGVFYGGAPPSAPGFPALAHLPGTADASQSPVKAHAYPGAGAYFLVPAHADFRSGPASVAHTRTLVFLKPILGGPYFDLEAIWEEHTMYEFADRSVERTMATMVQQPYVNNIPTVTGGVGREFLTGFYRDHFIFSNPADSAMELVSRTIGVDRIIDEFVFSCTHDKVIGWMLPGIPATGKKFEYRVPVMGEETAKKLIDENSVESNEMLGFKLREVAE